MNIYEYNKLIHSYDFSKFNLFESYGIINFNDKSYNELIRSISDDILNDKGESSNVYYKNTLVLSCKQLKYNYLDWCKTLYVFYDLDEDYTDSFVLSRKEFSTDNIRSLFDRDNFILNTGFIVIKLNVSVTKNEIMGILKHEIKHLYYYLKTSIYTDNSNKDILYQENYNFSKDFNFIDILKSYYNDNTYLESISEDEYKDILMYSIYYLNLNECRSMLENINNEIELNIKNRYVYLKTKQYVKIHNIKDFNYTYLIRLSETFAVYMFIYKFLKLTENTYNKIYNTYFKDDFKQIYNVNSLKGFSKLMLNRIDNEIITKSYKLYNHYKSKANNYED